MRFLSNLITSGKVNDAIKTVIHNIHESELKEIQIGLLAQNLEDLSFLMDKFMKELLNSSYNKPILFHEFTIEIDGTKTLKVNLELFENIRLSDLNNYNDVIIFNEKDNEMHNIYFTTYNKTEV